MKDAMYVSERGIAMQTRSGRAYYPCDPRPEDVLASDVAWALSHACRFGGHSSRHYSVLEHMVRCCDLALHEACFSLRGLDERLTSGGGLFPEDRGVIRHALLCLVHDAAEAYVCDLPRPLKVQVPDYARVEALSDAACYAALAGGPPTPDEKAAVKRVDDLLLSAERRALMLSEEEGGLDWGPLPEPPRCLATNLHSRYWEKDGAVEAEEGEQWSQAETEGGLLRSAWSWRLALLRRLLGLPELPA